MSNDATYYSTNWSTLRPDTGSGALCFLDPWGNPYVYVEWASVPQPIKDSIAGTDTTGPVSFSPNFGGTGGSAVYLHPHDPSKFDIYSFGPNGVNEGGQGDDVTSWSQTTKK